MADLIDRQAAIDTVRSYMADNWIEDSDWHANGIAYEIKRLPTADAVEVVRCKDCKHYVLYELFGRSHGWCERLCDEFDKSLARATEEDDFCSRGERREP